MNQLRMTMDKCKVLSLRGCADGSYQLNERILRYAHSDSTGPTNTKGSLFRQFPHGSALPCCKVPRPRDRMYTDETAE